MDAKRLRSIPLFEKLASKDLELVARHADEIEVPEGKVLTVEGERALEFFMILEGTATVSRSGAPIRRIGPGDFFGEIGVVQTTYRTATVTADSHMKLVVMFGPEFSAIDSRYESVRDLVSQAIADRLPPDTTS